MRRHPAGTGLFQLPETAETIELGRDVADAERLENHSKPYARAVIFCRCARAECACGPPPGGVGRRDEEVGQLGGDRFRAVLPDDRARRG
jgi:hypothetical protein